MPSAPVCPGSARARRPRRWSASGSATPSGRRCWRRCIRESWETAQTSESLKPIADPSIRNLKFEEGSPIEFELLVEVRPEIKLERTGGFRVERRAAAVPDSAVTEQTRLAPGGRRRPGSRSRARSPPRARWSGSRWRPSRTASPAPRSRTTWCWARTKRSPSSRSGSWTLLPGETVDTEVRFPEDHPDESRRGQSRRVRVTLHEVKRQELPPLDDAFAREVGDFENLDALRAAVRADLEREAERDADARVRQALLGQIVEANGITAPESLVHRLMHGYAEIYQIPQDQLARLRAAVPRRSPSRRCSGTWCWTRSSRQQGLRATEAERGRARAARWPKARGVPAGELYASLQKAKRLAELERATHRGEGVRLPPRAVHRRRGDAPDDGHALPAVHHRALQPRRADATTSSRGC